MTKKKTIAAKIDRHAGRVIIKVPEAVWKHLRFEKLRKRSAQPPIFVGSSRK
jgi:hypothetical protein